jgi:uncharacterized membrane protein YhhN
MKRNQITFLYFAVAAVFITLENLDFPIPSFFAKALIIPSLMLLFHNETRGKYNLFSRLILTGLFFSWLGDVLLQIPDLNAYIQLSPDLLFIGGLGAFLITHLFYFVAFILPKGKNSIFSSRVHMLVVVVLYGAVMIYFLYDNLGEMKVPVFAYTLVIVLMLLAAMNRQGKVSINSYNLVALGASLFIVSDSLIAVGKFHGNFPYGNIIIMITYVAAQYLIVTGSLEQEEVTQISGNKII